MTASLSQELTPEQEKKLDAALGQWQQEKYSTRHNNCAHFSASVYEQATGTKLSIESSHPDVDGSTYKVTSPVGLEQSIRGREIDQQTEHRVVEERQPEPKLSPAEEMKQRMETARAADRAALLANITSRTERNDRNDR